MYLRELAVCEVQVPLVVLKFGVGVKVGYWYDVDDVDGEVHRHRQHLLFVGFVLGEVVEGEVLCPHVEW